MRVAVAARAAGMRPFHHVDARPIMLQEIEVDGGEFGQRMPQIAHRRNGLQKNFRQHHGGAHIQIDAALVQIRSRRRRTGGNRDAWRCRSPRRRPPGCVCGVSVPMATCTVTGVDARRLRQQAVRDGPCASRDMRPKPRPSPRRAVALDDGFIHESAGLFGGAEAAIGQHRFHVFAGVACQRDFEIVNGVRICRVRGAGPGCR